MPESTPLRAKSGSALADAAQALAFRDWPVFPCEPRGKKPLTAGGFKAATTDADQIRAWWAKWPQANIGYATGRVAVVDIDGPEGMASRVALEAAGNDWPVTLAAMTGRRPGMHYYFAVPDGVTVKNATGIRGGRGIATGIDVRGQGGYVNVPPSLHPTGRRYAWAVRADIAAMPAWMIARLAPPPRRRVELPRASSPRYGQAALDGELDLVAHAPDGQLNDQLNRSAFKLGLIVGRGALGEGAVVDALVAAAINAGHPERAARRTVRSGLAAGMAKV